MMNMIAGFQADTFDKYPGGAPGATESDVSGGEDFAALFSVPLDLSSVPQFASQSSAPDAVSETGINLAPLELSRETIFETLELNRTAALQNSLDETPELTTPFAGQQLFSLSQIENPVAPSPAGRVAEENPLTPNPGVAVGADQSLIATVAAGNMFTTPGEEIPFAPIVTEENMSPLTTIEGTPLAPNATGNMFAAPGSETAEARVKKAIQLGEIDILGVAETAHLPQLRSGEIYAAAIPAANEPTNFVTRLPLLGAVTAAFAADNPLSSDTETLAQTAKPFEAAEGASLTGFENQMLGARESAGLNETTAPATPAQSDAILKQVEPRMLQLALLEAGLNNKKVLRMKLHPAELGEIEIRLEKNSSGTLSAYFQTDNETTRQVLTENIARLQDSLQNSGWRIERLEVSCQQFSNGGNGGNGGEHPAQQFAAPTNQTQRELAGSGGTSAHTNNSASDAPDRVLSLRA